MTHKPATALRFIPQVAFFCLLFLASRVLALGPDEFGYTASSIPISFEDLTAPGFSPTTILDNTDDSTVTIPIGFPFTFYGVTYTSVTVSTNGLLSFNGAESSPTGVNLTTTATPANLPTVAAFWHDWEFQFFGTDAAYYQTLGSPGARRLVVQWNFTQSATGPGEDTVTFEVKLFEGSNNIEFHYDDATISDDATNSNGLNATVGIRDVSGQANGRRLQSSFNQSAIADSSAIQIVAPQFKFTSITRLANNHALLMCKGAPNVVHQIQVSSTTPASASFGFLTNVTADVNGNFQFDDAGAVGKTKRFYRLAIP